MQTSLCNTSATCAFVLAVSLAGCNNKPTTPAMVTIVTPSGQVQSVPVGSNIPPGSTIANSTNGTTTAPVAQSANGAPIATVPTAAAPVVGRAPYNAPPPVAPGYAAAPAAAVRQALVVPAGTRVSVLTNEALSAQHSGGVGSGFTGSLSSPLAVRGTEVFRRGTSVRGTIVSANGRGHFTGDGVLGIQLTEIGGYRVESSEYVARVHGRGKRTAEFIGGGAGLGALIGGLAGGGKGALIGGMSGAGAGTVAGAYTGNRDVVIPAESPIAFTLRSSITMR